MLLPFFAIMIASAAPLPAPVPHPHHRAIPRGKDGTDRQDGDADGATALLVATSRCVWPFRRLLGPAACRGQHEPHTERDTDHRGAHGTCGRPGRWAL
eukprot:scaffold24859_cov71-Phaeocystis_antarctica.AAC.3